MTQLPVATPTKKKKPLLAPIKWICGNILLPFLPIVIKMLVNWFSKSETNICEPMELLYYNFFICILLLDLLKKKDTIFSYLVSKVVGLICIADILFIGFIATDQQKPERIQAFAIAVAILCASFGSIYVYLNTSLDLEEGNK